MKCNIQELAHMSDQPCTLEGRLNYRKISSGSYRNPTVFKERWFRLIKNYLFYFKISEMGTFDTKHPAGVFVMENSSIQMEHGQSIPFSFCISFIDEVEKRHILAARTEDNVVQWVMKLRECSYEYLRSRLHTLQSKIFSITGKDPLLMVPRNEGACLWAPAVPFSTVPACSTNTTSFSCHLHTHTAFTLERSKSDAQTYKHLQPHHTKTPVFYTDDQFINKKQTNGVAKEKHALNRSKTSVLPINSKSELPIFDTRLYTRAAPSPPVRKKSSPASKRIEVNSEIKVLTDQGRQLGSVGILDPPPVKPKRRSPKLDKNENSESVSKPDNTEDLISF